MIGGWVVDLSTGKSTWSDAVCAIHDVDPGQAPEVKDAIKYYIPEHREIITNAVQTCIDTGIPFDEELQIRTAKGRLRWVRAIGHAVKGTDGKITKLQGGAFQDITASRQAMEQIRRFAERQSTIFESITDAFFTVDKHWNFIYLNQRSEELLKRSKDELLGQNLWQMFPATIGTEFDENYRHAMASGESVAFEATTRHWTPGLKSAPIRQKKDWRSTIAASMNAKKPSANLKPPWKNWSAATGSCRTSPLWPPTICRSPPSQDTGFFGSPDQPV